MWIECNFDDNVDIELKYSFDDNYLIVECMSKETSLIFSKLYIYFNSGKSFEAAYIKDEDKKHSFNIQYSTKYLKSMYGNIDISYMTIVLDGDKTYIAHPKDIRSWENDPSIIRARELVDSVKIQKNEARECIDNIKDKIQNYISYDLPVLGEFNWHLIEDTHENFNLSSLEYIKNSPGFKSHIKSGTGWFFGTSGDDRLYALAVRSGFACPISNAEDCVVRFTDKSKKDNIYAIGILLLDDGQYFCRLD